MRHGVKVTRKVFLNKSYWYRLKFYHHMDESSKKIVTAETNSSYRRSISSYQSTKSENTGIRSCSQLCCSTRHNSVKGNAVGDEKKLKNPRAACHTSNKVLNVRSSKLSSSSVNLRSSKGKEEKVSVQESVAAESSSRQEHGDESGLSTSHAKIELSYVHEVAENIESETLNGPSKSPDLSAKLKSKKVQIQHNLSGNQDASSSDPVRKISTPRNPSKANKTSQGQGSISQTRGLRSVTSSSASDVSSGMSSTNSLPKRSSLGGNVLNAKTGISQRNGLRSLTSSPSSVVSTSKVSSDGSLTKLVSKRRIDSLQKGSSVGDVSATRRQDGIGSTTTGNSTPSRPEVVKRSVSKRRIDSLQKGSSVGDVSAARRQDGIGSSTTGNSTPSRPEVVKRSTTVNRVSPQSASRTTGNQPTNRNNAFHTTSQRSETKTRQTLPTSEISNSGTVSKPANTRTARLSSRESTTSQVSLRSGPRRSSNRRQACPTHGRHRTYSGEASQQRFDLGYYDRHRDMRMDIDGMSYEELLALVERIGTVSTALSEEALSNCLERSRYEHKLIIKGGSDAAEDEIKCSICQEEYVAGDEVGKLICEHLYHVDCIHQWLRQKNWCPVCKSHACPSYTIVSC